MMHRTDIAGSIGCSMGQANPVDDGICRHAPNGALIRKIFCRNLCLSGIRRQEVLSSSLMTAVPSVHAIYVETLGPIKR
jgi:hypothetical protein